MDGRHELKFYINMADYYQLKARLGVIAKLDENSKEDGKYAVNSLYFDNYNDKVVFEKLSGAANREKFRFRYYNNDSSYILLEKKSKSSNLTYKENCLVSEEQCESLLKGNYEALRDTDNLLLMELYTKILSQNLRPKSIVKYLREAYVYEAGNVRITFDSNVRTSNSVGEFLNPNLVTIPSSNSIILEIKYTGFLPDIIRDITKIGYRRQTEFSKYVVSRFT